MRLWSIHPKYLDRIGLVALWREALLARKVLQGHTKGYTKHPQLQRFQISENPINAINFYLLEVYKESQRRKYQFDKNKIDFTVPHIFLQTTDSQLKYEFEHIKRKLQQRSPLQYKIIATETVIVPHPLFNVIKGDIELWERIIKK